MSDLYIFLLGIDIFFGGLLIKYKIEDILYKRWLKKNPGNQDPLIPEIFSKKIISNMESQKSVLMALKSTQSNNGVKLPLMGR